MDRNHHKREPGGIPATDFFRARAEHLVSRRDRHCIGAVKADIVETHVRVTISSPKNCSAGFPISRILWRWRTGKRGEADDTVSG